MSGTPSLHDCELKNTDDMTYGVPVATDAIADIVDDQRCAERNQTPYHARLTDMSGTDVESQVGNISETGAFVLVDAASGLCLGDRYEMTLSSALDASHSAAGLAEAAKGSSFECCFATVVRTEQLHQGSWIGAGLRFDQPIYLAPMSTPSSAL